MSQAGTAFTPRTCDEVIRVWASVPEARLLAGGTDLLVRLKDTLSWPPLIVLERVTELCGITLTDGWLRLGARTTYYELERNALVAQHAPALAEAARMVGSPAIRNRGTLGGNLANASPAGDTLPVLLALDAELELRAAVGTRVVPLTSFFCGPGRTMLQPQELIAAVRIPLRPQWRSAFARLAPRAALAIAKVSAAVAVHIDADQVRDVRIALGAVAPTVLRATEAETLLRGERLTDALCTRAAALAAQAAQPISDIRSTASYRRAMCAALVRDLLSRLKRECTGS